MAYRLIRRSAFGGTNWQSPSRTRTTSNSKIEAEPTAFQTRGDSLSWFTRSAEIWFESSVRERQHDMKKASMTKADQDIPELKREQLGVGVRGK
jgi:hypothetical protein